MCVLKAPNAQPRLPSCFLRLGKQFKLEYIFLQQKHCAMTALLHTEPHEETAGLTFVFQIISISGKHPDACMSVTLVHLISGVISSCYVLLSRRENVLEKLHFIILMTSNLFKGSLVIFLSCKRWPTTWHKFLHYDREGVGRQVGHSSWCFSLSPPHPPGKSPLSWPEVPWYTQWISSLPLRSRHASPSGTEHPQEIWAQTFPAKNGGKPVISVIV